MPKIRLTRLHFVTTISILHSLIFYVLYRALLWLFPWRENEILILLGVYCLGAVLLWCSRANIRLRKAVIFSGLFTVSVGTVVSCYIVFERHYTGDYPTLQLRDEIPSLDQYLGSAPRVSNKLRNALRILPGTKNINQKADKLLAGELQFYQYPPFIMPDKFAWNEDPFGDPSWNWNLHNMSYVITLTMAYEQSGNTKYLVKAEQLILNWIEINTYYLFAPPSEFSWNDHSTAFRLLNWLYFVDIWRTSALYSQDKATKLMRSMQGHAEKLADPNFYTKNHNHGIDQDRALLAFSLSHPYFAKSAEWAELALSRVMVQFDFSVSKNGVHLEHSPDYHLYGLNQRKKTLEFFQAWDVDQAYIERLQNMINKMLAYVPTLLKPDGNIVQVGDTGSKSLTGYQQQLDPLRQNPQSLVHPGSTILAKAFLQEGYASIRDFSGDRGLFKDSFHLFFNAGAHEGRGHRQSDDLSFVLSNLGQDILVDPGYYSYKKDSGRDYVTSVFAHNTLALNGKSYEGYNTSFDTMYHAKEEKYVLLRASHRNYPNIEHTRWLLFVNENALIIVDSVRPIEQNLVAKTDFVEQMFHFAPDLLISEGHDPQNIQVKNTAGEVVALLSQLYSHDLAIQVVKGQASPMQGWHSLEHAKLIPTPTLISRSNDVKHPIITAMFLPNEIGNEDANFSDNIDVVQTFGQRYRIKVASIEFELDLLNNSLLEITTDQSANK